MHNYAHGQFSKWLESFCLQWLVIFHYVNSHNWVGVVLNSRLSFFTRPFLSFLFVLRVKKSARDLFAMGSHQPRHRANVYGAVKDMTWEKWPIQYA